MPILDDNAKKATHRWEDRPSFRVTGRENPIVGGQGSISLRQPLFLLAVVQERVGPAWDPMSWGHGLVAEHLHGECGLVAEHLYGGVA